MFQLIQKIRGGMTAQDAVEAAAQGRVILVDVRDVMEVRGSGKAKGALNLPLMRLQDLADPRHPDFDKRLKQDALIAVYCASGARSSMAASTLKRLGYEDVHNIGGLGHWVRAGGEVEAV